MQPRYHRLGRQDVVARVRALELGRRVRHIRERRGSGSPCKLREAAVSCRRNWRHAPAPWVVSERRRELQARDGGARDEAALRDAALGGLRRRCAEVFWWRCVEGRLRQARRARRRADACARLLRRRHIGSPGPARRTGGRRGVVFGVCDVARCRLCRRHEAQQRSRVADALGSVAKSSRTGDRRRRRRAPSGGLGHPSRDA